MNTETHTGVHIRTAKEAISLLGFSKSFNVGTWDCRKTLLRKNRRGSSK